MEHAVRELKLKNGAKGLLIQVPGAKVVNFDVEFRAGLYLGPKNKYELPHVMEHMMFTNRSYPRPRQFAKEVEKNGAFVNAYTTNYSLGYVYECANFEAGRIADLLGIQILEPTFPSAELKTELGNVREELAGYQSNHHQLCEENLESAATRTPSINMRMNQLSKIDRNDLEDFYKKTHHGQNLRFIIGGDIDLEDIAHSLDVKLMKGTRLKIPRVKVQSIPNAILDEREIVQNYYSWFSALDRRISTRELIAARIISALLTGGFSSILLGLAREKGLIYGMRSSVNRGLHDSILDFSGYVSPKNSLPFFKLMAAQIDRVLNGKISQSQFDATKELILGQQALSYQRVVNLVSYYRQYFENDNYEEFETYTRLIREISKSEAITAFQKLFTNKVFGLSFVGNLNQKTADQLQAVLSPLWR